MQTHATGAENMTFVGTMLVSGGGNTGYALYMPDAYGSTINLDHASLDYWGADNLHGCPNRIGNGQVLFNDGHLTATGTHFETCSGLHIVSNSSAGVVITIGGGTEFTNVDEAHSVPARSCCATTLRNCCARELRDRLPVRGGSPEARPPTGRSWYAPRPDRRRYRGSLESSFCRFGQRCPMPPATFQSLPLIHSKLRIDMRVGMQSGGCCNFSKACAGWLRQSSVQARSSRTSASLGRKAAVFSNSGSAWPQCWALKYAKPN